MVLGGLRYFDGAFINEPRHEKTNILGPTQTRLYSYKRWHEAYYSDLESRGIALSM